MLFFWNLAPGLRAGKGWAGLGCSGSLARCFCGCDTSALCAAPLVFGYNHFHVPACGWNVFYLTFWTARGFFFFPPNQSGLLKGTFEYVLLYHFTLTLGLSVLTFDCRDWWGLLSSTPVAARSCVDEHVGPAGPSVGGSGLPAASGAQVKAQETAVTACLWRCSVWFNHGLS